MLTGYVRLMQNRSAFPAPVSPTRSLRFVDALLREPNVVIGTLGPEWGRCANLYLRHTPVGGGVTDAWLAAAVLELKEHFVTFDRGFRKLLPPEQLTLLDPAAS